MYKRLNGAILQENIPLRYLWYIKQHFLSHVGDLPFREIIDGALDINFVLTLHDIPSKPSKIVTNFFANFAFVQAIKRCKIKNLHIVGNFFFFQSNIKQKKTLVKYEMATRRLRRNMRIKTTLNLATLK